ncbi:uncharacterized protein V1510DRAFT_288966 [Dipodascopsis tothii]|uniref:uncharacterized protein n=1 Tax=Dipodascopsis tothii TaxID=44089 RepID=UPI0034CE2C71
MGKMSPINKMVFSAVLSISCSDSIGTSGVETDLKTFQSLGAYGISIITEVISRSDTGRHDTAYLPLAMTQTLLDAATKTYDVKAVKLGYITSKEVFEAALNLTLSSPIVFDPSFLYFLSPSSVSGLVDYCRLAVSRSTLTVLAASELLHFFSVRPEIFQDSEKSIDILRSHGIDGSLLIHIDSSVVPECTGTDVLVLTTGESFIYRRSSTSQFSCVRSTLSSAIAVFLSNGASPEEAVVKAFTYLDGLTLSSGTSINQNPLNHGWLMKVKAVPPITPSKPHPFTDILLSRACGIWQTYINHPVCQQIAAGTLPLEGFCNYLAQDYHYLGHYARLHALAIYKERTTPTDELKVNAVILNAIATELDNHVSLCEQFGVSKETILKTSEDLANTAYSRYILDVGTTGSILELRVAAYSCLIGYGYMGKEMYRRAKENDTLEGNPFQSWLEVYNGPKFWDAVESGRALIEEQVAKEDIGDVQLDRLVEIFTQATRYEVSFFNLGLKPLKTVNSTPSATETI